MYTGGRFDSEAEFTGGRAKENIDTALPGEVY